MPFNRTLYLSEMRELVAAAIAAWRSPSAGPRAPIFAVSIWTDPDACASAISIDTRENSDARVQQSNQYNRVQHERHLREGDAEMAALFEGQAVRSCNPADFVHRDIATCEHESFSAGWESKSEGQCWDELEPALREVAEWARHELQLLELAPDAELAVNSRLDWYDTTWRLAP